MSYDLSSNQRAGLKGPSAGVWLWALLPVGGSVILSGKFSCATPFAALATLAALDMSRRDGLMLVVAVWLANQVVGFGVLGYPHDTQTYAWGLAIGVAAVVAYGTARSVIGLSATLSLPLTAAMSLAAAFVAYQAVLIASTFVLDSGEAAFSLSSIAEIALVNVIAFVVLLLVHRVVSAAGWLPQISRDRLAA